MLPVVEKPVLPGELRGLVVQLQAVLQQYGYTINQLITEDDSLNDLIDVHETRLDVLEPLVAAIPAPISASTYTPTLFNITNVAANTAYVCQWMRVSNVVIVSGRVDVDPTLSGTDTILDMSLPVASALAAASVGELAGTAICNTSAQMFAIYANITNDRARFQGTVPATGSNQSYFFTFMYRVL